MNVRVSNNTLRGVTTFWVESRSRPGLEHIVQYLRRNRRQAWFCNCEHFFTYTMLFRRHCEHVKHIRELAIKAGGIRALARALLRRAETRHGK